MSKSAWCLNLPEVSIYSICQPLLSWSHLMIVVVLFPGGCDRGQRTEVSFTSENCLLYYGGKTQSIYGQFYYFTEMLTLYTLTWICIFFTLFFIHFLRCWQGEFVCQSRGSFSDDHFLYSHDLHVWFSSTFLHRIHVNLYAIYIISSVIHAFLLVLTNDLLEDRRIDDVIIKTFFPYILILYYIKQIDSKLPCVCSVIDHRGRQNVVRTSVTHSAAPHVPLFCSYHILTSSVIY